MYLTMNATIDMVTISSKGQIVIPKKILKALGLKEQDKLLVFNKGDNILLKKVKPDMFEAGLREMLAPIRREAEAQDITEKDVET
jgi:AbrB family looped-hinge helix DNA binding protein